MEHTRESLVNSCILCTSKVQGKRIIKFYESFGFKNKWNIKGEEIGRYYCIYDGLGRQSIYQGGLTEMQFINAKIIKLPSAPHKKKLTFPREMWISDIKERIGMEGKMTIIGYCKELEFPWLTKGANGMKWNYAGFKYAEEI